MYFIHLLVFNGNCDAILKGVERGLLLNVPLISSIDNTLLPTDSKKSCKILVLNTISSETVPEFVAFEFSVTRSKSFTQFKSATLIKSLTTSNEVVSVVNPTGIVTPLVKASAGVSNW